MNWFDVFAGLWFYDQFRRWRDQRQQSRDMRADDERLAAGLMPRFEAAESYGPTYEAIEDILVDEHNWAIARLPDPEPLARWIVTAGPRLATHRTAMRRMRGLDSAMDQVLEQIDEALGAYIDGCERISRGDPTGASRLDEGCAVWKAIQRNTERKARQLGWRTGQ